MRLFDWRPVFKKPTGGSDLLCSWATNPLDKIVPIVAPSGAGKTASLFSAAREHFLVYASLPANVNQYVAGESANWAFSESPVFAEVFRTFHGTMRSDEAVKLVGDLVGKAVAAHVLYLRVYLEHATDKCDPFEFLMLQLNGRRANVRRIFDAIKPLHFDVVGVCNLALQQAKETLKVKAGNRGVIVAIDEIQAAMRVCTEWFHATPAVAGRALSRATDARGLLSPLTGVLRELKDVARVVCGTGIAQDMAPALASQTFLPATDSNCVRLKPLTERECCEMFAAIFPGEASFGKVLTTGAWKAPVRNVDATRAVLSTLACRPRLMSILLGELILHKYMSRWLVDEQAFLQNFLQNGLSNMSADVKTLVAGLSVGPLDGWDSSVGTCAHIIATPPQLTCAERTCRCDVAGARPAVHVHRCRVMSHA